MNCNYILLIFSHNFDFVHHLTFKGTKISDYDTSSAMMVLDAKYSQSMHYADVLNESLKKGKIIT